MKKHLISKVMPLIFDSISLGIFTVDSDFKITLFNKAAEKITGFSREKAIGKNCSEIFKAHICEENCPLRESIKSKKSVEVSEVHIKSSDGADVPISVTAEALVDTDGKVLGGVEMFRDISNELHLRKTIEDSYVLEDIVSKNPQMIRILDRLPLYANSSSTVLIEGASGTGKELIAKALHNLSERWKKPMITINCAALPDNLLESELFGYVSGAFTDAKKDKPGKFALADGGTIFLDEMGEISPAMQVKLLRVLQEKEFEPLGAIKTTKVDIRVIAATNRNLEEEVEARRFREDLFYRLNVIRIVLPPLSERREDVFLLAEHFRHRFNALQGRNIESFSDSALAAILKAPLKGNVRELENAIEHAFVLCQSDTIKLADLPASFAKVQDFPQTENEHQKPQKPLLDAEAATIRQVLIQCDQNKTLTAKKLGISRNTLWRKMKRFKIR